MNTASRKNDRFLPVYPLYAEARARARAGRDDARRQHDEGRCGSMTLMFAGEREARQARWRAYARAGSAKKDMHTRAISSAAARTTFAMLRAKATRRVIWQQEAKARSREEGAFEQPEE